MSDQDFIAYLHELFDPLGAMKARRMFGGWGVYLDGIIVGIVDEGRLYLKVDEQNQTQFQAAGCAPFVYQSPSGPMSISYWSAPDDAMDSSEAMAPWARSALSASLRKAVAKPVRKRKPAPKPKSLKSSSATAAKPAKKTGKRKPTAKSAKTAGKRRPAAKAAKKTSRRKPR
jgi:DNA transformation protein